MLAANEGLGFLIINSRISLSTELAYVAIFLLGIIGFLADSQLPRLRRTCRLEIQTCLNSPRYRPSGHPRQHRHDRRRRRLRDEQERRPLQAGARHRLLDGRRLRALRRSGRRSTARRSRPSTAFRSADVLDVIHFAPAFAVKITLRRRITAGASGRQRRLRRAAARSPHATSDRVVMAPDSLTVFAPQGMLGYGIPERSMRLGMERRPDVLAVDAGSIDPGPHYLGAGVLLHQPPVGAEGPGDDPRCRPRASHPGPDRQRRRRRRRRPSRLADRDLSRDLPRARLPLPHGAHQRRDRPRLAAPRGWPTAPSRRSTTTTP